jgi:hypothetical protein
MTFSTPTADPKSPCYSISVLTPNFYAIALACPSIDTFQHEVLLHKIEERRTARTDATNPEGFIQSLKHAADSYYRISSVTNITLSADGTSITDTQTWVFKTSKLVVSFSLWLAWPCVNLVREIFLLKMSGKGPDSYNGQARSGTKKQFDDKVFLHGDTYEHVKVTTVSGCFLNQYVHRNCGPEATLKYLFANLTTVVRERVLSICWWRLIVSLTTKE